MGLTPTCRARLKPLFLGLAKQHWLESAFIPNVSAGMLCVVIHRTAEPADRLPHKHERIILPGVEPLEAFLHVVQVARAPIAVPRELLQEKLGFPDSLVKLPELQLHSLLLV